MDFLRDTNLDLKSEPPKKVEINSPEGPQSVRAGESPKGQSEKQQDERIQLWMNNIKEFIKGIDVKSL
jgi:hypothetical protein